MARSRFRPPEKDQIAGQNAANRRKWEILLLLYHERGSAVNENHCSFDRTRLPHPRAADCPAGAEDTKQELLQKYPVNSCDLLQARGKKSSVIPVNAAQENLSDWEVQLPCKREKALLQVLCKEKQAAKLATCYLAEQQGPFSRALPNSPQESSARPGRRAGGRAVQIPAAGFAQTKTGYHSDSLLPGGAAGI